MPKYSTEPEPTAGEKPTLHLFLKCNSNGGDIDVCCQFAGDEYFLFGLDGNTGELNLYGGLGSLAEHYGLAIGEDGDILQTSDQS